MHQATAARSRTWESESRSKRQNASTISASGAAFTPGQKADFKAQNMAKNDGVLRSDQSGIELVPAKKSERGVTPSSNEAAVDHYNPRNPETGTPGTNNGSNARVISREEKCVQIQ